MSQAKCVTHIMKKIDPYRSFFMVETFRRTVWPTCRLLATRSVQTNKTIFNLCWFL